MLFIKKSIQRHKSPCRPWNPCQYFKMVGHPVSLNQDGKESNGTLDRTALALKLARQRASQGLSEGREEIEAADFLTALRSYTAPSGATFHQIVTRHHDLNDKAINVIDNTDPDATEDEEGLENEQPIATGQEDIGKNVSGTLPICEIANGKRKRESNRPKFMIWTNVTNPPTIISNTPRSKAPLKRQSRPNTNASTSTASKHLGFLNQTLASIAAHKHKKAPPTPRKSTSTGNSPTSEESASSSSAKPVVTLPTPPLRACNESVVDKKRRRSTLVKNKLTTMPEEIDDEEVECMEKLERTSRSGRTIKETKKWTTLEYRNT